MFKRKAYTLTHKTSRETKRSVTEVEKKKCTYKKNERVGNNVTRTSARFQINCIKIGHTEKKGDGKRLKNKRDQTE